MLKNKGFFSYTSRHNGRRINSLHPICSTSTWATGWVEEWGVREQPASWKLRGSFLWNFREIRVSANGAPVMPTGEFPLGQKHRLMRKFPGNEWDYNFIAQLPAQNLFNLHNSPDCFSHYYWKVIPEPHFLYLWANFWSPAGIYEQTIWNHSFLC